MQVMIDRKKFNVSNGADVRQALREGGVQSDGFVVFLNGHPADLTSKVNEGATITLAKGDAEVAEDGGGATMVMIGKLPGKLGEYRLGGTPTIKAALKAANLDSTGYEIYVDGVPETDLNAVLRTGSAVALVVPVEGNRL